MRGEHISTSELFPQGTPRLTRFYLDSFKRLMTSVVLTRTNAVWLILYMTKMVFIHLSAQFTIVLVLT